MTTDEGVVVAIEAVKARIQKPRRDLNKKYAYELIPFAELRPGTRSPYLVHGVIPLEGLVAVWGPPKCGKSFWTFDLVMHIALGKPYRELRVQQGTVVYLAFEGAEGFKGRAEAYRRKHKDLPEAVPFYLLATSAKLVRDHKALIEAIDGQTLDLPPVCVVLDTLNRSIDGSESKDLDMAAYIAAAGAICDAFACVVIIVHHCGVDASRPRGHTSLTGAVDSQLSVKRDAQRNVIVEVEAMKDGAEGASFASALELVEVGIDDEGKPMTSCVIVPVDGAAAAAKAGPKLSDGPRLALNVLRELVAETGEPASASNHVPAGVKVISAVVWRETFCNRYPPDTKPDTKARAFLRATLKLQETKLAGMWKDKAWLCQN
jgi:hypothetical protein